MRRPHARRVWVIEEKVLVLLKDRLQLLAIGLRALLVELFRRRGEDFRMVKQRLLHQFLDARFLCGRQRRRGEGTQ